MTDTAAPQAAAQDQPATGPVPMSPQVTDAWDSLITMVPDAQEGDGLDSILRQLAAASDVSQLDAPWRTQGLDGLEGVPLTIMGIHKVPSDFTDGLAWFLVVDAIREDTGEMLTITTGAVNVVAQLTKTYQLGGFPCRAKVVIPDRATKRGYYPPHLEYLARKAQAPSDSGAQS